MKSSTKAIMQKAIEEVERKLEWCTERLHVTESVEEIALLNEAILAGLRILQRKETMLGWYLFIYYIFLIFLRHHLSFIPLYSIVSIVLRNSLFSFSGSLFSLFSLHSCLHSFPAFFYYCNISLIRFSGFYYVLESENLHFHF